MEEATYNTEEWYMHENYVNEIGWEGVNGVHVAYDRSPTSIAGVLKACSFACTLL
jgi:hypothetical protein